MQMITHVTKIVLKFKQMVEEHAYGLRSETMSERPGNCKGVLTFVDTDIVV